MVVNDAFGGVPHGCISKTEGVAVAWHLGERVGPCRFRIAVRPEYLSVERHDGACWLGRAMFS
jgi:hypothetical protein